MTRRSRSTTLPAAARSTRPAARSTLRTALTGLRSALTAAPAAALCAGILVLSGCSPDGGLRVESPEGRPVPSATQKALQLPPDKPFSAATIRDAAVGDAALAAEADNAQVLETLLYCTDCIKLSEPLTIGEQKFQIAMVVSQRDHTGPAQPFAGLVVAEERNRPAIKLVVSGTDLTLTPGQGGTLVAQESLYRTGDKECCPSGWSVRVFRYHGGHFEAGQRISRDGGN